MAQALYDYWFVQFDFPDENGKPYKSSGGKMVWNEVLKREIPADWAVAPLSAFGELRNGVNYGKGERGNSEYKIINVRNISASRHLISTDDLDVVSLDKKKGSAYIVKKNDILIARSGVPGAVRLIETNGANIIFCGFIIAFAIHDMMNRYSLYYQLKEYEGTTATTTGGTILQNVSQETLKRLQLLAPTPYVLREFNACIARIYGRLESIQQEITSRTKQRDFLLPLLMNGQVQVKPLNYRLYPLLVA